MRGMATTSHTMTVAEAAHELGVSERTVWRYLRSGRLHGETTGPVGQQQRGGGRGRPIDQPQRGKR